MNPAQKELLKLVFALKPWGRDRISRAVGCFLDGDLTALDKMPTLRDRLLAAIAAADKETSVTRNK